MVTKVGAKGQVVIDQEIREQLGIQPGMMAVQQVVDGHVAIHFLPGPHDESLAGAARPYIKRYPSAAELDDVDALWEAEARRHVADPAPATRSSSRPVR